MFKNTYTAVIKEKYKESMTIINMKFISMAKSREERGEENWLETLQVFRSVVMSYLSAGFEMHWVHSISIYSYYSKCIYACGYTLARVYISQKRSCLKEFCLTRDTGKGFLKR